MNISAIVLGLVLLFALSVLVSLSIVNKYFSLKKNYNKHIILLSLLISNMACLLSITYLLPIDIWVHKLSIPQSETTTDLYYERLCSLLDFFWVFIYWFQFILCWIFIPIMMAYVDLKYIAPVSSNDSITPNTTATNASRTSVFLYKLKKSVLVNLKFYGVCLAGLVVAIIYLKTISQTEVNIKPLLISLTHLYSITYTLVLLAYGLNIVPFYFLKLDFWRQKLSIRATSNANASQHDQTVYCDKETQLYMKLSKYNDEMNECKIELVENYSLIMNPNNCNSSEVQELFQSCKREVEAIFVSIKNDTELNNHRMNFTVVLQNATLNADESSALQTLEQLNTCYNKFVTEYYNFMYAKEKFQDTKHVLDKIKSDQADLTAKNVLNSVLGICCLLVSLGVAFVELVPVKFHSMVLSAESNTLLLQTMMFFMYMTVCCLVAISKFKIADFHLISNGSSNPRNTLYYSLYSSRLLLPLCFNFSSLIRASSQQPYTSSFQKKLYVELYPIVSKLNVILPPIIMIAITASFWFNLKDKLIVKLIGRDNYYQLFGNYTQLSFDSFDFEGEEREDLTQDIEYAIQEGKHLYEQHTNNYI
ncbi:hypothetical protein ACO0QE_000822 [Hanseniaspora vineae]